MDNKIKMTKNSYKKKPGTQTVWVLEKTETNDINTEQYNNIIEAAPFFKSLGGTERTKRGYTSQGYKVISVISISPDKELKSEYNFDFDSLNTNIT